MKHLHLALALSATLLFTACGGGGSSKSSIQGSWVTGHCSKFTGTSKNNHLSFTKDKMTKTYYRYYGRECDANEIYFKQVVHYSYRTSEESLFYTVESVETPIITDGQLGHLAPQAGKSYVSKYKLFPELKRMVLGSSSYHRVN